MTPPSDSVTADHPQDSAAAWFVYLHSDEVTEAGRQAFERWRQADPEHDRQYQHVQSIWQASEQIPPSYWQAILARQPAASRGWTPGRRRFVLGLASACAVGAVGGIIIQRGWFEAPRHTLNIVSRRGERRQVTLPDGSVLDVNTGSTAEVRLYEHQRVVALNEGEIFFDVRHDVERPFVVQAGDSRIVVTGTRFNVRHEASQLEVSVESGSVDVSRGPWWQRTSRSLGQGQAVSSAGERRLGEALPVDMGKRLAWQRGRIVFENTPLSQAVAEINRYLDHPARLDAPALRDYRIAGTFSVTDPLALIDTLPSFAPVRVLRRPDGLIRIVSL